VSEDQRRRHVIQQGPEQVQERATSLVVTAVIGLVVIGALYLAQSARTAAAGRTLQDLEARRQELEQQNAQLRAEIAGLQSVPRLTARAEELGFHHATVDEIEYMPMPDLPPAPAITPTPIPLAIPEEEPAAYEETLGGWLTAQWERLRGQIDLFIWREAAP
jgi:cell division protein FtsB